jgi:hypothetical protein
MTIIESTISGNIASTRGGGIANVRDSLLTIERSTLSGNQATGSEGGAIFNPTRAQTTIIGSTISGNSAATRGGGIRVNSGSMQITSSTITGNSAGNAAGGIQRSGAATTVTVQNTIIAGNTAVTANPDVQGVFVSSGHNLIGNVGNASGFNGTGDQVGTGANPINPLLGALQNNGGPTATHLPLTGSPAIDKGVAASLATDQRGSARTDDNGGIGNATGGDGTDIGAIEVATILPPPPAPAPAEFGEPSLDAGAIAAAFAAWEEEVDPLEDLVAEITDIGSESDRDDLDAVIFG